MTRDEALTVLGLDAGATREEIACAHRELAQMLHPDKYGDSKRLRARAEAQMKLVNEARDVLLKGGRRPSGRRGARATADPASPEAIAFEAAARANAAESTRLMIAAQLRTLLERRRTMASMAVVSLLVMLVCSRLRGTVGALVFSVASMLTVWGAVDVFRYSGEIRAMRRRSAELIRTRDAARDIARQAQEL